MTTHFVASVCTTICHFSWKKRLKMAIFWSKNDFFGLRQAVEDCPPILRVLDTKKQIVGTHRSRKHNLQHPYAPKYAVFHKKNGHKWPFSGHILIFFGFVQAVEGPPPPILRVLDAKKQVVCTHGLRKHNLQHLYAPKFAIFHRKTAKNGRFLVKN